MKKLVLAAAALVMLSTASMAESSLETMNRLHDMRMQFMTMNSQMIDAQMEMMKQHMMMLTNFQKVLKQQMDNESESHRSK